MRRRGLPRDNPPPPLQTEPSTFSPRTQITASHSVLTLSPRALSRAYRRKCFHSSVRAQTVLSLA